MNDLLSEANVAAPHETGGILLGYSVRGCRDTVVTHGVGPGPNAVHAVDRFIPDCDYHDAEVARVYEEFDGKITYLGDWHSHPNGHGELSQCDRQTFRSIAVCPDARIPEPVMLILADSTDWNPVAWRGRIVHRFAWFSRFVTVPIDVETYRGDR